MGDDHCEVHMNDLEMTQLALMAWGVQALGERLDQQTAAQQLCPMPATSLDFLAYQAVLFGANKEQRPSRLLAPLSVVHPPNKVPPNGRPLKPVVLQLEGKETAVTWPAFAAEFAQLPGSHRFEAFTHLFAKYAWAVPGNVDGSVSLYEEFKALAALVFASGGAVRPADTFLLIGGDTSGIQEFIFTVSSKAAAKGLRGRSFFLQLVGDAIVRRLLDALQLPTTNLIYAAGGNFLLLAPSGMTSKLEVVRREVNQALLDGTQGQLRMTVGWREMAATAVADPKQWREAVTRVKESQQSARQRPLAELAKNNWQSVFHPMDDGGNRFCMVCHRGLQAGETAVPRGEDECCTLCASFDQLARDIRHEKLWLSLTRETAVPSQEWARILYQISGYAYRFSDKPIHTADKVYRLNNPDFLASKAHGFRFLANVTPTMTTNDLDYADQSEVYYEHPPKEGDIRDFDVMARDGEGVKWLGVLRMDVDNLGKLFSQWLPARNMLTTSALSSSLERFFSGHLNRIVRENGTISAEGEERLAAYVIYAGGDDLFIVGVWQLLPQLAQAIHEQFRAYTHNDYLTISAGIGLMPRTKYPLYLAAKDAHEALDDQAKGERWELFIPEKKSQVERETKAKDAISFLGTAVGWQNWPQVVELQQKLVDMQTNKQAARSLIQLLQNVHALFDDGRKQYEKDHPEAREGTQRVYPAYYGRWQWLLAYQFKRIKNQNKSLEEELDNIRAMIEKPVLTPYVSLAARWVEYQLRELKAIKVNTQER